MSLGMWLCIASEVMLFGGLFSAYVLLRSGVEHWAQDGAPGLLSGLALTLALLLAALPLRPGTRKGLVLSTAFGLAFLLKTIADYGTMASAGMVPASSTFLALYYLLTGVHALHVLGGVVVATYLAARGNRSTGGDSARFANRVRALSI